MANQTIQHQCSFCKRVITVRDQYDLPIYDPNTGFAICKNCVREINHFLDEHESAVHQEEKHEFGNRAMASWQKTNRKSSKNTSTNT